jgi:death-on-curing protein
MDDIELLCIDDILNIHKEAIEMFGGSVEYYQDTVAKLKA